MRKPVRLAFPHPPPAPAVTPLQAFCRKWGGGCGSDQCGRARSVVLCRGQVPCHILIIAEAPGASEDVLGRPLVGPAGKLMDRILVTALGPVQDERQADGKEPLRVAMTNLVGCLPRGPDDRKAGEPEHEQVLSCRPRLEEFARLCAPRLVVAVGRLSAEYLRPGFKDSVRLPAGCKVAEVVHPAAVLRANAAQQGLMRRRAEIVIQNAAADVP